MSSVSTTGRDSRADGRASAPMFPFHSCIAVMNSAETTANSPSASSAAFASSALPAIASAATYAAATWKRACSRSTFAY